MTPSWRNWHVRIVRPNFLTGVAYQSRPATHREPTHGVTGILEATNIIIVCGYFALSEVSLDVRLH